MQISDIFFSKLFYVVLFSSATKISFAEDLCTSGNGFVCLDNPIGIDSTEGFIGQILNIAVIVSVPIIVLAFVYSGFLFIKAQGNPEGIKSAKNAFFMTLVGAAIMLGAKVIYDILANTAGSVVDVTS